MKYLKLPSLCFVCIFWSGLTVTAQDRTIHFVTDSIKEGGYLIEVTKAACDKVGYTTTIEFQPLARALTGVMSGQSDAFLGAAKTPARVEKMYYSESIGKLELLFFKLKGNKINYSKISDLTGLTVGYTRGSIMTPDFAHASNIKKMEINDVVSGVRMLLAKRLDLLIIQKKAMLDLLKTDDFKNAANDVDYMDTPYLSEDFYNCFSKAIPGNDKKLADFNKGLDIIKKDGTLAKIMMQDLHE